MIVSAERIWESPKLDAWTEATVTADGHSLACEILPGGAMFTRTGPGAIVKLGEGRPSVRRELEAEGVTPEIGDRQLDAIIASVQNGLREK